MNEVSRSWVLTVACASTLAACASHGTGSTTSALSGMEPLAGSWGIQRCDVYECGSNSPIVFGSPLGGLMVNASAPTARLPGPRPDGEDGLIQGTFEVGGCDADTLTVRNGRLVGIKLAGAKPGVVPDARCTGDELVGGRVGLRFQGVMRPLWIRAVGEVETWEKNANFRQKLPTYRFTLGNDTDSICPDREATWMTLSQIEQLPATDSHPGDGADDPGEEGTGPLMRVSFDQWRDSTDHALIVQGETYDQHGDIARRGEELFNIACAGNALAKMRLLGFDPMARGASDRDRRSTPEERTATLKMLTARYDGTHSFTHQGQAVVWRARSGITYFGDPAPVDTRIGPIESAWNQRGAMCLSHLRVAMRTSDHEDRFAQRELSLVAKIAGHADGQPPRGLPPGPSRATIPACERPTIPGAGAQPGKAVDDPVWVTLTWLHLDHPE